MDTLSLSLLCSEKLSVTMDGLLNRPGGEPLSVSVTRPAEFTVNLAPWPFK